MGDHIGHEPDAILALLSLTCLASFLAVFIFWLCTRSPTPERQPIFAQTPTRWPPPYDRPGRGSPPTTPPTPDSFAQGRRPSRGSRYLDNSYYYALQHLEAQPDITDEPIAVPRMPAFGAQVPPMLVLVQSPPSTIDAPSTPSSHLSAPGNLGPDVLSTSECNYFDTVRSLSAPAVLVAHDHTLFAAGGDRMEHAYQPQIPTLPLSVEATPTSGPEGMGAGEEPPETYPNGQPHPSWDASGNYYWPYIPDEYERMIYHEVDMWSTEEMMISPEPKPVWPEGERPLAPHWYPGGRDKPEDACFPFQHVDKPPQPGSRPTVPVRNLRMLVDYDAFLEARRNALIGKRSMRFTSWSSSELAHPPWGYGFETPFQPRCLFGVGTDIDGHSRASACDFEAGLCACRPGEAGRREGRMGICFYCAKFFADPAVRRLKLSARNLYLDHLEIDPCTPQLACLMTDWAAFILQDATRNRKTPKAYERRPAATSEWLKAVQKSTGFRGSFSTGPSEVDEGFSPHGFDARSDGPSALIGTTSLSVDAMGQ